MAQDGDTITYTFSDGNSVAEDVSSVNTAVVEYMDGCGGNISPNGTNAGNGGRVENAEIDLSSVDTLYIWVGGFDGEPLGRYSGGYPSYGGNGGSSTEISLQDTNSADSNDEPFLVAAGGGGGSYEDYYLNPEAGGGGARNGTSDSGNSGEGVDPPLGGDGLSSADESVSSNNHGDGAIDDQNRGYVSGGTTIRGGGSGPDTDGEIQISYMITETAPPVDVNGAEASGVDANGSEVSAIEVNGQEI